jgi:membrane fusion protein (multidrug efflux system)
VADPPKVTEAGEVQEQESSGIKGAFQKHPVALIICFGLIVVGTIAGIAWYLHARHYESTDDAFIDGRPVLVSAQVAGSIITVNVTDNQIVKSAPLSPAVAPNIRQSFLCLQPSSASRRAGTHF